MEKLLINEHTKSLLRRTRLHPSRGERKRYRLKKEGRQWIQKGLRVIRVCVLAAVHVRFHYEMIVFLAAWTVHLQKTGSLNVLLSSKYSGSGFISAVLNPRFV